MRLDEFKPISDINDFEHGYIWLEKNVVIQYSNQRQENLCRSFLQDT